jgi:hypothetical protein
MSEPAPGATVIVEETTLIRIQALVTWLEELKDARWLAWEALSACEGNAYVTASLCSVLSQLCSVIGDIEEELEALHARGAIVSFRIPRQEKCTMTHGFSGSD